MMELPAPLAVAEADPAVAPVAAAVSAEVSGEAEGVSLLDSDAVAAGRVPRPAEMPFSEWLKWRAGSGKRPTRGRDGVSTTMQQEAALWKALMSAYYGEERAEALEEAGAEHESRPSPALSELSGEPGVEELQTVLRETYDPRKERLDVFEARINRSAEGLLMLGIEVAERQEEVLLEASAINEVYGVTSSLDPAVMVRTARDFFVGISIDPHISDRERRNRARGHASLIRTFGGKTSEDPTKLFSTPSLGKAEGGGPAVSAARPVADESDRLRGKVADLQLELEAMRKKLGEGGDADSVAPSALGSGAGRLELTEVLKQQTEVLKKAFSTYFFNYNRENRPPVAHVE